MPNESWTADRYKQEMRCLSHRRRPDRIATVHWLNGSLRLTIWGPDGPHYHLTFANTEELERELRHDWRDDPKAGQRLDAWALTDEWAQGLKQCQFVNAWNRCSFAGRYDLCERLDAAPSLDAALEIIPQILAELRMTKRKG